jgi:hypothetical protein
MQIVPMPEPELKHQQKYAFASRTPGYLTYEDAKEAAEKLAKKHRREKSKVKIRFRAKKHVYDVVLYLRLGKPDESVTEPEDASA